MDLNEHFTEQEKLFKTQFDKSGSFDQYLKDTYNSTETLPLNTNLFAPMALPEKPLENLDYTTKKLWTKIKSRLSFIFAYQFYKKGKRLYKFRIEGKENLEKIDTGAVITSNHFSIYDSLPIIDAQLHMKKRRRIYKILQEANYTMKGVIGSILRNNYSLFLSRSPKAMRDFMRGCDTILKRKQFILIYPEQELWPDYQKPRTTRPGAFQIACRSNVPVLPCYTEIRKYKDNKGNDKQQYILHILEPIYPNTELSSKEMAQDMQIRHFKALKDNYETLYNKPLTFGEEVK